MIDYSEFAEAVKNIANGAAKFREAIGEDGGYQSSEMGQSARAPDAFCLEMAYRVWCATVGAKTIMNSPQMALIGSLFQQASEK
jgi:hypothetical protein